MIRLRRVIIPQIKRKIEHLPHDKEYQLRYISL